MPTVFIDCMDLLAKAEIDVLTRLLIHAKALANEGILYIVLISSKVSVGDSY